MVRFRTSEGEFAVPVERSRGVRLAREVLPLPGARPAVEGLIRDGDRPVPVISALGGGRDHVLLIETGAGLIGVLVEEVSGISSADEAEIQSGPAGQEEQLFAGVIPCQDGLVLLVDPDALSGWAEA